MHDFILALYITAAGYTASGILANLYRLLARNSDTLGSQAAYVAVMVIAGPTVLLGNATNWVRSKNCSRVAFWLVAAIATYWSFVVGLFLLDFLLAL